MKRPQLASTPWWKRIVASEWANAEIFAGGPGDTEIRKAQGDLVSEGPAFHRLMNHQMWANLICQLNEELAAGFAHTQGAKGNNRVLDIYLREGRKWFGPGFTSRKFVPPPKARTQGRCVHTEAAPHILRAADELSAAARLLVTGPHPRLCERLDALEARIKALEISMGGERP